MRACVCARVRVCACTCACVRVCAVRERVEWARGRFGGAGRVSSYCMHSSQSSSPASEVAEVAELLQEQAVCTACYNATQTCCGAGHRVATQPATLQTANHIAAQSGLRGDHSLPPRAHTGTSKHANVRAHGRTHTGTAGHRHTGTRAGVRDRARTHCTHTSIHGRQRGPVCKAPTPGSDHANARLDEDPAKTRPRAPT